ncbi:MAG: glycoside hydrolase family 88 protein [Ruminococcus sp.]|uniref:glycoside hydrolase family 88/105 protein n=1 Tax=Ruminococcus sp. TaxID=41978 RepID=UPI0025F86811|nr:glycoside hydrolase family 88 protein [Ruminococcus sp.]MCR5599403.1 glycoside hydrolase family 88 protein [Ruminococcus sp.]
MNRSESIINKYIDNLILQSDPLAPKWNMENILYNKAPKWNYVDNCMITALLMLYDLDNDPRLLDYSIKFTNAYVKKDGSIPTMNCADYNLDNINGAKNLMKLWKLTGEERYRFGFEKIWKEQLIRHPRLSCGSFWHKAIYPEQIWIDGVYMVLPFMAEYGKLYNTRGVIEDVKRQFFDVRKITRDPKTGLYYHGYDDTSTMCWADKITGLSPEFWLRSNGWLCAALADVCEILPNADLCSNNLSELLHDITKYCDDEGMLLQLPIHKDMKGNYPETSGSLLYAYSALKAARLGVCGDDIRQAGLRTFSTVTEKFIDNTKDVPVLRNICLVGGLGGENHRNGSAEYYLSEKVVENDAKGIAPYIMAYTEVKKII